MKKKQSVCIIGAGAAGLCSLRHFTTSSSPEMTFDPIVCFEQTDQIGGTWVYNEAVGTSDRPVHSSMYRDMRVNGPVQIMDFPDFPFKSPISYTHHSKVLEYLNNYTQHFNLLPYIHFQKSLLKISRINTAKEGKDRSWLVKVQNQITNQTEEHNFDVVILSPGRYSTPKWPQIEGLNFFSGLVIHSHDYRSREPYSGQRVVVVGAGPSGIDITLEVASVASEVIFLNRGSEAQQYPNLPNNILQIRGQIDCITGPNSLKIFKVDEEYLDLEKVNAIILATGYQLSSLACLDQESCGLKLNSDDTVEGIYRHLINIRYPSMALLSICKPTLSFPFYHQQTLYFMKTLLGAVKLPSTEEMHAEMEADAVYRKETFGLEAKDRHLLKSIPIMKSYFELLERDAQLEPIKPVVYRLLEEIVKARSIDPVGYKEINYRLLNDEEFEVVSRDEEVEIDKNESEVASSMTDLSTLTTQIQLQKGA